MADDGGVGPGVLCVEAHGGILEDDEVEGLIEPSGETEINGNG